MFVVFTSVCMCICMCLGCVPKLERTDFPVCINLFVTYVHVTAYSWAEFSLSRTLSEMLFCVLKGGNHGKSSVSHFHHLANVVPLILLLVLYLPPVNLCHYFINWKLEYLLNHTTRLCVHAPQPSPGVLLKSLSAVTADIAALAATGISKVQLACLWLSPHEISLSVYHLVLKSYSFS